MILFKKGVYMYLRTFDPDNKKYCLIEFNVYVGDLPKKCGICEVVTEFAREKLIKEKENLVYKKTINFECEKSFKEQIPNKENIKLKKEIKELKEKVKKAVSLINNGNEIEATEVLVKTIV
jgi:hypothetical protein